MRTNTGTYVYDKKLKKIVKISDRIPSKAALKPHVCSGDCGHCACHED